MSQNSDNHDERQTRTDSILRRLHSQEHRDAAHDDRPRLNCPECGGPLRFVPDPRPGAQIYECRRDGKFNFGPNTDLN